MSLTEAKTTVDNEIREIQQHAVNLEQAAEKATEERAEAEENERLTRQELADRIRSLEQEYSRRLQNYRDIQREAQEAELQAKRSSIAFRYLSGELTLLEAIKLRLFS